MYRVQLSYIREIEKTFDQVNPKDYDLLILPGGFPDGAPRTVSKNINAQKITKFFFDNNKTVAAICHGPYTLISSGVVKGRNVTSFWGDGVPEELKNAGAKYEDTEVVVDKNLITSRYPMDLPVFMREIMKMIGDIKK
jgi:protease I